MEVEFIHKLASRLGVAAGTVIVTVFSVMVSVPTYLFVTHFFGGFNRVGLIISIITPAIIAPVCSIVLLRMALALYQAEGKLREARDELERKVAEQTGELRRNNEQLKDAIKRLRKTEEERAELEGLLRRAEKMEALGVLAGGVAHDLNNVLGVLVGYSELLLLELSEDSPLREHVSNIHQSGKRGAAIIQDLLTLGRRGVVATEVLNLNDLISSFLQTPEFKRLKAGYPDAHFHTELAPDLLNMKGSAIHLSKTVMNLMMNGLEAIPAQGEVFIRTENRYLDTPTRGYDRVAEGDYVLLKVSDNGKGISPNDMDKIFEPFYTKKVMGRSGTGLGLTVVWGTVKDHSGYIDVQSVEGKGSTFTLYFPVTREAPALSPRKLSPADYRGRGEFLLVVDDVEGQRTLATEMLAQLGYTVAAVSSGEEAVSFIKQKTVDLLVLDMIMDPGMDGLDSYRRIIEVNPGQRAVIVSGFSETDRVAQAQALGAGPYVRKPYVMEKIGMAIREELDKERTHPYPQQLLPFAPDEEPPQSLGPQQG